MPVGVTFFVIGRRR